MSSITKTTRSIQSAEITRAWHLIDMKGNVLGRMVPQIVKLLQGKHKSIYVPYLDVGDNVVVINAKHMVITGKKIRQESLVYYSGYPSGKREVALADMLERNPVEVVRHAVAGMLPKSKNRDQRTARLHIFTDDQHPFQHKFKS